MLCVIGLIVFVNYLLNEFAICFNVVFVFVLNMIVLLFVCEFSAVEETMYCLSEYVCVLCL